MKRREAHARLRELGRKLAEDEQLLRTSPGLGYRELGMAWLVGKSLVRSSEVSGAETLRAGLVELAKAWLGWARCRVWRNGVASWHEVASAIERGDYSDHALSFAAGSAWSYECSACGHWVAFAAACGRRGKRGALYCGSCGRRLATLGGGLVKGGAPRALGFSPSHRFTDPALRTPAQVRGWLAARRTS